MIESFERDGITVHVLTRKAVAEARKKQGLKTTADEDFIFEHHLPSLVGDQPKRRVFTILDEGIVHKWTQGMPEATVAPFPYDEEKVIGTGGSRMATGERFITGRTLVGQPTKEQMKLANAG